MQMLFKFLKLVPLLLCGQIMATPVTYVIPRGGMECLYDTVKPGEFVTVSVFVATGDNFKAPLFFEGPFLPLDDRSPPNAHKIISTANDPHTWDELFHNRERHFGNTAGIIREHMFADFEDVTDDYYYHDKHPQDEEDDDHYQDGLMDDQYYKDNHEAENQDDVNQVLSEDDSMTAEQREEVRKENTRRASLTSEQKEEERRRRAEEKRIVHEEMKKERERRKNNFEARMKEKEEKKKKKIEAKLKKGDKLKAGQPFLKTFHITEGGWYRLCVTAENGELEAQMDLRKSSEVGQPNESGHLSTYERHQALTQEKEMFEKILAQRETELHDLENEMKALNATESAKLQKKLEELKEGIHLHDLESTRTQIHTINRLLNDIREKQQFQMNRLSAHYSLNQNSHRRMVLTSLMETMLYIAVSIFQVYTIRKWFRGSSLLGY